MYELRTMYTEHFLGGAMGRYVDRVGMRYNRLLVVSAAGRAANLHFLWTCVCDCGSRLVVDGCSLVTGNTQSCGCYLKERITKHGGWKKGSYNTWRAMMRRCTRAGDKDFARYGAKGITVCAAWHDYEAFARDMGEPEGTQTLDRIDPYGAYTPENCRWADLNVQARNLRVTARNKSGFIGVNRVKGRWRASLSANNKKYTSKLFDSFEEALRARKEFEQKHWG